MNETQEAIFDAIVEQRKHFEPSDIFVYDVYEGQEYLNSNGLSDELGIEVTDHFQIISELAEMGAIRMMYTEIDYVDGDSQRGLVRSGDRYYNYEIFMNHHDIMEARKRFKKSYSAELVFDDDDYSLFHVHVDINGGRDYYFRQLRTDGYPYKLIKFAAEQYKQGNKDFIMLKELKDAGLIRPAHNNIKSLFQDLEPVREALPQFVLLIPKGIRLIYKTKLSLTEIETIKKYSHN